MEEGLKKPNFLGCLQTRREDLLSRLPIGVSKIIDAKLGLESTRVEEIWRVNVKSETCILKLILEDLFDGMIVSSREVGAFRGVG